jgi:hypothetical protein
MRNKRIPIGEITDQCVKSQLRAGAVLIPTPEWVDPYPYTELSAQQKAQMMNEVEKPIPPTVSEIIKD